MCFSQRNNHKSIWKIHSVNVNSHPRFIRIKISCKTTPNFTRSAIKSDFYAVLETSSSFLSSFIIMCDLWSKWVQPFHYATNDDNLFFFETKKMFIISIEKSLIFNITNIHKVRTLTTSNTSILSIFMFSYFHILFNWIWWAKLFLLLSYFIRKSITTKAHRPQHLWMNAETDTGSSR